MKLAYNGSHAVVDVPALGRSVERGEAVDIDNENLARTLKRQGWVKVKEDRDSDDGA